MDDDLVALLEPFGVEADAIVPLDTPLGPEHIAHLDLHPEGTPSRFPARIDAVVEMSGRPVLYVKRGRAENAVELVGLLAQRGAADYLAFVEPGQLTVVALHARRKGKAAARELFAKETGARGFVPGLASGTTEPFGKRAARALTKGLFTLLHVSTRELTGVGVEPDDALALVGRALFFRFLVDREIVTARDHARIAPGMRTLEDAMSTPEHLTATSDWLDRTFNGHLLPLDIESVLRVRRRSAAICTQLTHILMRADATGQLVFEWDKLDFGHIPIGLLSEVYESWSHDYRANEAKRDSVWYTPATIAEFMVSEGLSKLEHPHEARVLDPAAGGGVFLVAAFRALVAARWKQSGVRPDRNAVRDILYTQLTGFDVNDAALRLAALALYLTALELDPDPGPGSRARFKDLRRIGVLHDVSNGADEGLPPVGSLAERCCEDLHGAFDVVVGNPPWTAWAAAGNDPEEKARNKELIDRQREDVEKTVTAILCERLEEPDAAFTMVQNEPDLPMLWCATRWARPDGVIALAMHGHILFRRTPEGIRARENIFRGLTVTGVLNGAALRKTMVWPQHEAPFALVFARNRRSNERSGFHFLSPTLDGPLNAEGYLRLDASARHPVIATEVRAQPWLLKTLFRGGLMDAPVVERILGAHDIPFLGEWWPERFTSRGFIRGKGAQKPCPELRGRDELFNNDAAGVVVPKSALRSFTDATVTRPRIAEWKRKHPEEVERGLAPPVFRGPVVVVRRVPRIDPRLGLAMMSSGDLLYDDSFLGFSASWHAEAEQVARYLTVFLNSRVALYTLLLSAAGFGVERPTLLLDELRGLRLPRWETLSDKTKSAFEAAWSSMQESRPLDRAAADAAVAPLFGLSRADLECTRDTLDVALPIDESAIRAQAPPEAKEQERFRERVQSILAPLLRRSRREMRAGLGAEQIGHPWRTLCISTVAGKEIPRDDEMTHAVLALAVREGASRVVMVHPGTLVIAIFAQYRYWTPTQARSLAMEILDEPLWMQALRGGGP
jgi:hypothetical protein